MDPRLIGPFLAERLHDDRWRHSTVGLLAGGRSNLTYRVTSPAGQVVIRRPPVSHVLPTAHDMLREYRVISALGGTSVPVAGTYLYQPAEGSPLGSEFYVMESVVGHVCDSALPPGYADDPVARRSIATTLVGVLAAINTLDPRSVGLADFGRPQGFVRRQLRRWGGQLQDLATERARDLLRLHGALEAGCPDSTVNAIVHGDFRLANTIVHPSRAGEIVAVLDWEMSTLGDPLTDLAMLLLYWPQADDDDARLAVQVSAPVSILPGFPTRAEMAQLWSEQSGHAVTALEWYMAFAYFKLAVILEGILVRASAGAMLDQDFDDLQGRILPLIELGHDVLRGRRAPI